MKPPSNTTALSEDATETPRGTPSQTPTDTDPEREDELSSALPTDPAQRYVAAELLGRGGMGEVRAFRDQWIGRDVAIKTVRPERLAPSTVRRFLREARIQGQIEHPSIVPVYDLSVLHDGSLQLAMRRIRGRTLLEILNALSAGDRAVQAEFSRRKLLNSFVNVCLAVDYAHERGVLHRDLKPGNLMFGDFGEVYVLDWGIAKLMGSDDAPGDAPSAASTSETHGVVGTPGYMSPEQARGESQSLDRRSDVYSLGVTLFEILALESLRPAGTATEILAATVRGIDGRPSARRADVPPELDAACARATALVREDRFTTARELSDAIEHYLDGDRDLARRRELAAEHAAKAAEILQPAASPSLGAASAETRRAAMREVGTSLALDPEQADARGMLVRMLVEVPDALPPAAETEMRESWMAARMRVMRLAPWGYGTWLPCVGIAWLMGVRNATAFWSTTLLVIGCCILSLALARRPRVTRLGAISLGALTFAATAFFSTWLGPFVLVPVATACAGAVFCYHGDRLETRVSFALMVLTLLAPFVAEWIHLVPPSYDFHAGELVLHARAVVHRPGMTTAALLYSSLGFSLWPPVLFLRLRGDLRRAERKLFLHSWHLNHLVSSSA